MEKELKSCTSVLLRADLTGHSHPTLFGRNWLNWPCPVRSALKRTPVQDFNSFSIMFYYIISTTYQKIGDLFCPIHISGLRTVCREVSSVEQDTTDCEYLACFQPKKVLKSFKKIITEILCNFLVQTLQYFQKFKKNFCPPKHRKTPQKSCS